MNKPKLAHLVNLIDVAMIDGKISEEEKTVLYNIAETLGATNEEFEFCVKTAEESRDKVIIEVPDTDEEKTFFLKNLTIMMMSDGQIDDNEKQYIKFIAEKFGYDGEKALQILMENVADEICEKLSKEESKEDKIKRETQLGKDALLRHDIPTAFDHLIYAAHMDRDAFKLFLMIVNARTSLFLLSEEQVALLKELAEKDYALSQYAYGRYLEALRPDKDALNTANEYFKKAEKAGVPDAIFVQSVLFKAGHYGMVDREEADRMVNKAFDKSSLLAARHIMRQIIYGWNNRQADPQLVIDTLNNWLNGNESDDILLVDPLYYNVLGEAYAALDDKTNAEKYYRKAISMGYIEAWSDLCLLHYNDENYLDLLNEGCDAGDPYCFVYRASNLMNCYDDFDEKEKAEMDVSEMILEDLLAAYKKGADSAAYFLGDACYYGRYGFERNTEKAWYWFSEGSHRDDGNAYQMLAIMIYEENNPYEVSEGLMDYCSIMALRNGCHDMLDVVVESYRDGNLTDYAAEIERYYLPEYEQRHENDEL